jgi:hypothetical protein
MTDNTQFFFIPYTNILSNTPMALFNPFYYNTIPPVTLSGNSSIEVSQLQLAPSTVSSHSPSYQTASPPTGLNQQPITAPPALQISKPLQPIVQTSIFLPPTTTNSNSSTITPHHSHSMSGSYSTGTSKPHGNTGVLTGAALAPIGNRLIIETGLNHAIYSTTHHKPYKAERRGRLGDGDDPTTRWVICDNPACMKWRALNQDWAFSKFFCGYNSTLQSDSTACAEIDDWILRCLQGDIDMCLKLAQIGVTTIEVFSARPELLDVIRTLGIAYDISTQTLKRLQ